MTENILGETRQLGMDHDLCEAAIDGNVVSLIEILKKDKLILHRAASGVSNIYPLHIAASYGHEDFVKKLLESHPGLARVLDGQHRTALHLASAGGHVGVVNQLITVRPEMCLACDNEGMNPIHVAAMEGKTDVMKVLLERKLSAAAHRVNGGKTILHLCVNSEQMESLKILLEIVKGSELVNATDDRGNTVLHLAVIDNQLEMVTYLLDEKNNIKIDVNARNASDQTALDIDLIIRKTNATKMEEDANPRNSIGRKFSKKVKDSDLKSIENFLRKAGAKHGYEFKNWMSHTRRDALIVVASLIATMAFQAAVSPPGGVWQENTLEHRAGEAIMAYNYPDSYPFFLRANTVGFVGSVSIIFLLISELRFQRKGHVLGLVAIICLTITSMAFQYSFSITEITPKKNRDELTTTIMIGVIVWCGVVITYMGFKVSKMAANVWKEWRKKREATQYIEENKSLHDTNLETADSRV